MIDRILQKIKIITSALLFVSAFLTTINAYAQGNYNISGKITDEKGLPLKSATVFIAGSEKITMTDDYGDFTLSKLNSGNFRLSVSMIGYAPATQAVAILNKSVKATLTLNIQPIMLNTVKIGGDGSWAKNYAIFKEQFLGKTQNGRQCVILNPEVLSFMADKTALSADADDFLVIENKRLGYRIKYRLKYFSYNFHSEDTGYDGDANFEQLNASEEAKSKWPQNRLETYKGSMMHFLRSAYFNTALKEGFLTYRVLSEVTKYTLAAEKYTVVKIDKRPIKFDTVVNVIDDSFISLAAQRLYIIYDPAAAAVIKATRDAPKLYNFSLDRGSTLNFYLKEAIIDRRGSYADYRTFLIKGDWSKIRIGDQLPFEYQPAAKVPGS
jgi:hypothetical protein